MLLQRDVKRLKGEFRHRLTQLEAEFVQKAEGLSAQLSTSVALFHNGLFVYLPYAAAGFAAGLLWRGKTLQHDLELHSLLLLLLVIDSKLSSAMAPAVFPPFVLHLVGALWLGRIAVSLLSRVKVESLTYFWLSALGLLFAFPVVMDLVVWYERKSV